MAECSGCGKPLEGEGATGRVASICGSVMGDEQTDVYYRCPHCGVYTVAAWTESFCGEDTVAMQGPLTEAEAAPRIELIGRCATPWDKKCRCEAHQEYFRGWLD